MTDFCSMFISKVSLIKMLDWGGGSVVEWHSGDMRISGDVAEDIVKEQGIKTKGQVFFVSGPSPPQGMALPFFLQVWT